ncbi:MAG TPA: hypothetical protein VIV63_13420 [Steroidobacteraceae bacterium]
MTAASFDVSALIPWYLNGTLSDAERAQVEKFLRESPDAEPQLQMWRAVQLQTRTQPLADPGTELGWRGFRRELGRVKARDSMRLWRITAAASVLLIAGLQTAILMRQDDADRYAPLSGTTAVPADSWRVQVRFVETATVADINALLLRIDARVIRGPSALGIYEIILPRRPGDGDAAVRATLQAEPLLLQAVVMP